MMIEIDFSSDEAIYIQLTNQIIMGIATSRLQEGDTLPSVRQLADTVGINMHTVNKAYSLLRQEGFVTIDRRRGAVISIDVNKRKALEELKQNLMVALAKRMLQERKQRKYISLLMRFLTNMMKTDRRGHGETIYQTGRECPQIGNDNCEILWTWIYRNRASSCRSLEKRHRI